MGISQKKNACNASNKTENEADEKSTSSMQIEAGYIDAKFAFNPQTPKVFRQPKTPKGGLMQPPWIFAFPSEFFENISHGYVFGVKESNDDNEKILSLLHDLENQGQTPFCMTFLISGCKHDTKLILVSILTFSRSRISNMFKNIM